MSRVVGRAWGAFLLWAVLLGASAALLGGVFDSGAIAVGLLGTAAAATALLALIALVYGRTGEESGDVGARSLPDLSHSSALVGIGFALLLLGLELGLWLVLVASGLVALGVGGVLREARASRRTARLVAAATRSGAEEER
jgi:hypothetical protein